MNKLYCLIGMLITCGLCNAQVPNWEWARNAACSSLTVVDEGIDVATDAFGNSYITGGFSDSSITFGSYTLIKSTASTRDVFLTKYDFYGNVLWAKCAGGAAWSTAYGITTDVFGNVYLTGSFGLSDICFDGDTLISTGGYNVFIVKYDSSGNVLWAKSAGGISGNDIGEGIVSDFSGNVIITGYFNSATIAFDSINLVKSGGSDIFVAKYDSAGLIQWAKRAGGTSIDQSFSITADNASNLYITGYFNSPTIIFGSDTLHKIGGDDMFITKYDLAGNAIWARRAGGADYESGLCAGTNLSGNVFVGGFFNSPSITFGSFTLLNPNFNDLPFLVKYDSLGNVLWAKDFSGGYPFDIAVDSMDNFYLSGSMSLNISIIFDTITINASASSDDPMFIVKYNSSGNALWAKPLDSGGDDHAGIALGINGSIYISGDYTFVNPFIVGNDSLALTCGEEIFVAKLGFDSNVAISKINENEKFILYPNPFYDMLNISNYNSSLSEVFIYDITSRKLLQQKFTNSVSLNTKQLAKGIYLYEVRNKNGVIKKGKVVKE